MLANEGYVPASTLYVEAFNKHYADAESFLYQTASSPGAFIMHRSEDILFSWFFDFIRPRIYVTDAQSPPTRIDGWTLNERWYVDLAAAREYEVDGQPVFDYPDEIIKSFSLCAPIGRDAHEIFEKCEDEEFWESFKSSMVGELGQNLPPLFFNVHTFAIDLRLYEHVREPAKKVNAFGDFTELYASILKPFEGQFLCVAETDVDALWEHHWDQILSRSLKQHYDDRVQPDEEQSAAGRPRKQEAIADYYRSLFPNGHENRSWKSVMNDIERHYGVQASVDTLKRGLGLK